MYNYLKYSGQDLAEDRLGNGYLGESHELITDALNTMLQVYGPLHSDIESSHKLVWYCQLSEYGLGKKDS